MIDDEGKRWLRGAYQDRIFEVAINFAAGRTHFVDAEWNAYIGTEFGYLPELTEEDHGFLREQAGLEAWKRVRDNNIAKRRTASDAVRAEHPDIIVRDAGFAFDIGWIGIVRDAVTRMRTYPASWKVRLDGGKEKFGCLVLFVSFDVGARRAVSEVERMREEARLRSLSTCEICGKQGRLRIGSYAKTVCDEHAAVLGHLREDDGRWADPWNWTTAAAQPIPRPKDHEYDLDPMRQTPLGRRIDDDTWEKSGREQELLLAYGYYIMQAVIAAKVVMDDQREDWISGDIERWDEYANAPLSVADRRWLLEYVLKLVAERDETNE